MSNDHSNRIDAEIRAQQNERMAQQEADYRAAREADYQRAQRDAYEREAAAPVRRGGGGLPLGCMVALGAFLVLLWGSQFVLMVASGALGAATMEARLAAVNAANSTLIALLLVGTGLGWLLSRSRGCLGAVLPVAVCTALALGLGGWQVAQAVRTGQAAAAPEGEAAQARVAAPTAEAELPTAAAAAPDAAPALATRVVTADALMLRAEPSTSAPVLTRLLANQEVTLLGEERQVGDILWVRVRFGEYEGWASAAYLN